MTQVSFTAVIFWNRFLACWIFLPFRVTRILILILANGIEVNAIVVLARVSSKTLSRSISFLLWTYLYYSKLEKIIAHFLCLWGWPVSLLFLHENLKSASSLKQIPWARIKVPHRLTCTINQTKSVVVKKLTSGFSVWYFVGL